MEHLDNLFKNLKTPSKPTLFNKKTKAKRIVKAEWATINGVTKYYRSRWELNYAHYLEYLRSIGEVIEWQHEPRKFWFENVKQGITNYTPDFRVVYKDEKEVWVEIKGYIDKDAKTKERRFKKHFPKLNYEMITAKEYKQIEENFSRIVNNWKS